MTTLSSDLFIINLQCRGFLNAFRATVGGYMGLGVVSFSVPGKPHVRARLQTISGRFSSTQNRKGPRKDIMFWSAAERNRLPLHIKFRVRRHTAFSDRQGKEHSSVPNGLASAYPSTYA